MGGGMKKTGRDNDEAFSLSLLLPTVITSPVTPSSVVLCAQMFVGGFSKENKARRFAIGGRSPSRGGPPIDRGFPELCFSDRSLVAPFPLSQRRSLSLAFCLAGGCTTALLRIPPAML
ncbi:hypothetical protein CEXT_244501 [Caerostris extrusa]|uniref:Uncharacterized protein n=1 Tax=Caerostris extrusa TaxID=172846 RepID=A0AAV4VIU5_CAEEX|nr:hypothetical protein CEXT_244501 [Caerostris extrusa]